MGYVFSASDRFLRSVPDKGGGGAIITTSYSELGIPQILIFLLWHSELELMENNAPVLKAGKTKKFCHWKGQRLYQYSNPPGSSSDLNPIENICVVRRSSVTVDKRAQLSCHLVILGICTLVHVVRLTVTIRKIKRLSFSDSTRIAGRQCLQEAWEPVD